MPRRGTPAVQIDSEPPAPGGRQARRRERTRASLIEAGRTLFARKGVEATRINEITEEADVGFGSFYNHFASKEEIVEAVLEETVSAQGAEVQSLTSQLEDPAEVVSVAHRYFVNLARTDPDWGWLLVRLESTHSIVLAALEPHARRDLARGIRSGRFEVADRHAALLATGGALVMVMRAVLDGRLGRDAASVHAEGVLRLLGVPPHEAAAIARRPMPGMGEVPG